MKRACIFVLWFFASLALPAAFAQDITLRPPEMAQAGTTVTIGTSGSGAAVLYVVGPGGVIRRDLHLGDTFSLTPSETREAGHYSAFAVAGSSRSAVDFEIHPASPARLAFLAKPSRLPVDEPNGISGVVYVFDEYDNLVVTPQPISFQLTSAGRSQKRDIESHLGVASVTMASSPKAGIAQFQASLGQSEQKRVVQQVPGDACRLSMTAKPSGAKLVLETAPVSDCSGNPLPDGTIVTFTEKHNGTLSTVDVPLKRGVARTELPAEAGSVISVATGVVMGNEIRWSGRE